MNILGKKIIKTSLNVSLKKDKNKLIVTNNSDKKEKIIFLKSFKSSDKKLRINSKGNLNAIENATIKVLSRRLRVIQSVDINDDAYLNNLPSKVYIGISILPKSTLEIDCLEVDLEKEEKKIEKYFSGNILLICPGYPLQKNKYLFSFIHSRVLEYKKSKMQVDVAVVNREYIDKTEFSSFEDVELLEPQDLSETQIILYSHGTDALYRVFDRIGQPYFTNDYQVPEIMTSTYEIRDYYIKKYNDLPNVKFVFVSNWAKEMSERIIGIKYNNSEVIPCFIDENQFPYQEKDENLRKKVFILRNIDVRVILELSKRECFKDMEFSIYGDGNIHEKLVLPIKDFPNVHIYKKFLTHEEIRKMHAENGIGLFATRFDTQAVSSCEAAMSGCVVISSKDVGTCEYIDEGLGTFCETENIKEYADLIEKLYNEPKTFKTLSKKMHESVMKTCRPLHWGLPRILLDSK